MYKTQNKIKTAYKKSKNIYDSVLTSGNILTKAYNKVFWGIEDKDYVNKVLSFVPKDFSGNLLDVPVGTGIFTAKKYKSLKNANIIALDYSEDMLQKAKIRFKKLNINNIKFIKGDITKLQFKNESFDLVLSMNGFHAFKNKKSAFIETARVLKKGGIFCGCFYVRGERITTDLFIKSFLSKKGWFSPPFYTKEQVLIILSKYYSKIEIHNLKSIVYFKCIK